MLALGMGRLGDPWGDVAGVAPGCCLCPSGGDRVLVLHLPPLLSPFPVLAPHQKGCRGFSGKGITAHRAGRAALALWGCFSFRFPLQPWGWGLLWVPHPRGSCSHGEGRGAVGILRENDLVWFPPAGAAA